MFTGLRSTAFNFPRQQSLYTGKVRDVYDLGDLLVIIASDRISAFDHILPRAIPYKGQVLTQLASLFLKEVSDIVPNWLIANPHPNVSIGYKCDPIPIEMVIRGYLAGHAWRTYASGERVLCGVQMPDGMHQNDAFPEAIITPATKAVEGHDLDISKKELLEKHIVSADVYQQMERYTRALYNYGCCRASEHGLLLVDTKYEFGLRNGKVYLIDEIHTPDSSRYFYADGYSMRQAQGLPQESLSKEFVREWLMDHDFMGKDGQSMPEMPDKFVQSVSDRYIDLYQLITGEKFIKGNIDNIREEIEAAVLKYINDYYAAS
ncbi:UNVERIFIED_CONTAM: hypothetical protein GTU68_040765 [Idotea baltica]|nr:hypothetical protein [Idotea baltica]